MAVAAWGLLTSHRRMVLSQLAEARVLPSRLKDAALTNSVVTASGGPREMRARREPSLPCRRVLSPLAEARVLPSGLKATLNTKSVWPVSGSPMAVAAWGLLTSHR